MHIVVVNETHAFPEILFSASLRVTYSLSSDVRVDDELVALNDEHVNTSTQADLNDRLLRLMTTASFTMTFKRVETVEAIAPPPAHRFEPDSVVTLLEARERAGPMEHAALKGVDLPSSVAAFSGPLDCSFLPAALCAPIDACALARTDRINRVYEGKVVLIYRGVCSFYVKGREVFLIAVHVYACTNAPAC